jgi:hypothetical protein
MLIFDPEIIEKLSKKDKTKIIVKEISDFQSNGEEEDNETTEENMNDCEGVKAVNTPGTGLTEIINVEEKYPKTQKSLKEESNETRISSNKYHKVNSFLSLNENHFKEGYSNTPCFKCLHSAHAFTIRQ